MAKDTRQEWEIARDEREATRNDAANGLLPLQINAVKAVMKTIMSCDQELHETYDLGVDNMKAIDRAEWQLRSSFPAFFEDMVADMTCTCED